MVGVPGRSKGCSTCRNRKKRCDQTRPICGNCIRGSFVCGGYERGIIMVHANDSGKGTYTTKVLGAAAHSKGLDTQCDPASMNRLVDGLNRASLGLQVCESFCNVYLPAKDNTVASVVTSFAHPGTRWAEYTLDCLPRSEVTKCALLALSATKLGRDSQDKLLKQKGMEMYGKALSLFAKDLRTLGRVKPFEVLNCCRILALYEQLNDISSAAFNWTGHIRGLLSLIRSHPPEAFSHAGAHEIFLECRYDGVTSALSSRTATFLSSPEWIDGPWEGRQKSTTDTAMDILVKLPGILEEWDLLNTQLVSSEATRCVKRFQKRCLDIDLELCRWYRQFTFLIKDEWPGCADILLQSMDGPYNQMSVPDLIAGIDLQHLHGLMIYYQARTILSAMLDLADTVVPSVMNAGLQSVRGAGTDFMKYLLLLAKSGKYFLKPDLGLLGTLSGTITGAGLIRTVRDHQVYYPQVDLEDLEQLRILMEAMRISDGFDSWHTWKCGMDALNSNKKAILDRYYV